MKSLLSFLRPRLLLLLGPAALVSAAADNFPAPRSLGPLEGRGAPLQRTMRLLATSTPQQRHTVRLLYYGQSITEQKWTQRVTDDLRARFPHAHLVVENRALGGFAAGMLARTAETDLYPFQPDLLIFHVYGAHDRYEDIIRRVRERTTAEVLIQNDHLRATDAVPEETAPERNPRDPKNWAGFMNFNWLPHVARTYGAELADQRSVWKSYLADHRLEPRALLRDNVHLNAHGEFLMAEIVKSYLRYDPTLPASPAEAWVRTHEVGRELAWQDGRLRLRFHGHRIDLIARPGASARPAIVRIDGRRPSEIAELYGFTRALATPGGKWPVIAPIGSQASLLLEEWTLEARRDPAKEGHYTFGLAGSKTGPDGAGRSDTRFVSNSGRIVIAPEDWNVAYALKLPKIDPVPERFTVRWRVEPRFADEFVAPAAAPGIEAAVTVAQGLPPGEHILEIEGDPSVAIAAVRVFSAPLAALAKSDR